MRLTQRTALDLFEEHGFDAVTVNQIAGDVGMAASTLYRHFSTKEAILLWDEHDQGLDEALEEALGEQAPFAAMRTVFVAELGGRYDNDLEFQLRRTRYIFATEQVHAAAVEANYRDTVELAEGIEHFLSAEHKGTGILLAGAAMLALDVAFDRWQADDASTPLAQLIDDAFGALEHLAALR